MTVEDRPAFVGALLVLGETFGEAVSEVRLAAYFDALEDVPLEDVLTAIRGAMRSLRFFPKPAELRDLAAGSVADHADLAWGAVLAEVRRVGYCGTPRLEPQALETVRQVWGGWVRLCETLPAEGPEVVGWMKQFKSVYQAVSRRDESVRLTSRAQLHESVRALLPKGAR